MPRKIKSDREAMVTLRQNFSDEPTPSDRRLKITLKKMNLPPNARQKERIVVDN